MFEGDSAVTCALKFPLMLMGGQEEGLACTPRSEDPHRREQKLPLLQFFWWLYDIKIIGDNFVAPAYDQLQRRGEDLK